MVVVTLVELNPIVTVSEVVVVVVVLVVRVDVRKAVNVDLLKMVRVVNWVTKIVPLVAPGTIVVVRMVKVRGMVMRLVTVSVSVLLMTEVSVTVRTRRLVLVVTVTLVVVDWMMRRTVSVVTEVKEMVSVEVIVLVKITIFPVDGQHPSQLQAPCPFTMPTAKNKQISRDNHELLDGDIRIPLDEDSIKTYNLL